MTVLVDDSVWHWRDRRWAHLVSDESFAELHEFASELGCRRMGFQGDHYDIDEDDRARALDLGAQAISSRELVNRLNAAGLRRRNDKPTWQRIHAAEPGTPVELPGALIDHPNERPRIARAVAEMGTMATLGRAGLYVDTRRFVLVVDIPEAVTVRTPTGVDELWVSGPRVDGTRSIEAFMEKAVSLSTSRR